MLDKESSPRCYTCKVLLPLPLESWFCSEECKTTYWGGDLEDKVKKITLSSEEYLIWKIEKIKKDLFGKSLDPHQETLKLSLDII